MPPSPQMGSGSGIRLRTKSTIPAAHPLQPEDGQGDEPKALPVVAIEVAAAVRQQEQHGATLAAAKVEAEQAETALAAAAETLQAVEKQLCEREHDHGPTLTAAATTETDLAQASKTLQHVEEQLCDRQADAAAKADHIRSINTRKAATTLQAAERGRQARLHGSTLGAATADANEAAADLGKALQALQELQSEAWFEACPLSGPGDSRAGHVQATNERRATMESKAVERDQQAQLHGTTLALAAQEADEVEAGQAEAQQVLVLGTDAHAHDTDLERMQSHHEEAMAARIQAAERGRQARVVAVTTAEACEAGNNLAAAMAQLQGASDALHTIRADTAATKLQTAERGRQTRLHGATLAVATTEATEADANIVEANRILETAMVELLQLGGKPLEGEPKESILHARWVASHLEAVVGEMELLPAARRALAAHLAAHAHKHLEQPLVRAQQGQAETKTLKTTADRVESGAATAVVDDGMARRKAEDSGKGQANSLAWSLATDCVEQLLEDVVSGDARRRIDDMGLHHRVAAKVAKSVQEQGAEADQRKRELTQLHLELDKLDELFASAHGVTAFTLAQSLRNSMGRPSAKQVAVVAPSAMAQASSFRQSMTLAAGARTVASTVSRLESQVSEPQMPEESSMSVAEWVFGPTAAARTLDTVPRQPPAFNRPRPPAAPKVAEMVATPSSSCGDAALAQLRRRRQLQPGQSVVQSPRKTKLQPAAADSCGPIDSGPIEAVLREEAARLRRQNGWLQQELAHVRAQAPAQAGPYSSGGVKRLGPIAGPDSARQLKLLRQNDALKAQIRRLERHLAETEAVTFMPREFRDSSRFKVEKGKMPPAGDELTGAYSERSNQAGGSSLPTISRPQKNTLATAVRKAHGGGGSLSRSMMSARHEREQLLAAATRLSTEASLELATAELADGMLLPELEHRGQRMIAASTLGPRMIG